MISVLKKMSHVRTGPFNRLLVFFAAFMVLMGESIGVIYIAIADRILPTYLAMIFQFVGYIIGGLILYHAIKKIPPAPILNDSVHEMEDIQEATEPKKPKQGKDIHGEKSKNSSIAFIMNFLIAVSIIKLLQFLLPIITSPDRNPSFCGHAEDPGRHRSAAFSSDW